MYKTTTNTGTLVNAGHEKQGLPENTAKADADARNKEAEKLGITTRYEVRPL